MKINKKDIKIAVEMERRKMKRPDSLAGFPIPFRCDNKKLLALINKSLSFVAREAAKDVEPKSKMEDGDMQRIAGFYSSEKPLDERLTLLFNAAMDGCASAQHEIAMFYYDGENFDSSDQTISFSQNRNMSALWEFLSAINGYYYAQYNFSYNSILCRGKYDFVTFDNADGIRLMELAANQGYPNAEYEMASLCFVTDVDPIWGEFADPKKGAFYATRLREQGIYDFERFIDGSDATPLRTSRPRAFIDFLSSFKRYWENQGHSEKGVASYMSSMRRTIQIFESNALIKGEGAADLLEREAIVYGNFPSVNETTQNVKKLLLLLINDPEGLPPSEKTKSNYTSAIAAYFDYIFSRRYQFKDDPSLNDEIKVLLNKADLNKIKFEYNHSKIASNFNTRLNTQDRVYEHLCLPICLMNQIIGLNKVLTKKYRALKTKKRESTKFLISKDGSISVPLSSIERLSIAPNQICEITTKKGDKHEVYTEMAPFNKTQYEKLNATAICDLSIDHDKPLRQLLEGNYLDYTHLVELGKRIAHYFNHSGDLRIIRKKIVNINASIARDIIAKENIDAAFAASLYSDLDKLYSLMEYTIMYGPYNSLKSDGD